MSYNLEPIGALPHFRPLTECYRTDKGFILSSRFGGPGRTHSLNHEFKYRDDDIFVVSFPKTGTTWMQQIVYLLGTNLDVNNKTPLFLRCPCLEFEAKTFSLLDMADKQTSPRFLKFHYPYSMIPKPMLDKKLKILYPIRNPKDTLVSYYHFSKMFSPWGYDGDFATFFDDFLEGKVLYGPYWKHVTEFWDRRHDDNILVVKYEDMIKDLLAVIQQICEFMGKSYSDQQLQDLLPHCTFEEMKTNPSINPDLAPELAAAFDPKISPFMRKGQVGDWKNFFTEEMNERMDKYIEKYFGDSDLKFTYE